MCVAQAVNSGRSTIQTIMPASFRAFHLFSLIIIDLSSNALLLGLIGVALSRTTVRYGQGREDSDEGTEIHAYSTRPTVQQREQWPLLEKAHKRSTGELPLPVLQVLDDAQWDVTCSYGAL